MSQETNIEDERWCVSMGMGIELIVVLTDNFGHILGVAS